MTVYKITNLINNKIYIGSTKNEPKLRWNTHKASALNPNAPSYKYPLQQALRKYGIDAFKFEIIKNDFYNEEDMQWYEQQLILLYNSTNSKYGYNQSIYTRPTDLAKSNAKKHASKKKQRCALVNDKEEIIEIYESYNAAARANGYTGLDKASAIRDVCKGIESCIKGKYFRDIDEQNNVVHIPFKPYKGRKKVVAISISNPDQLYFFDSILNASLTLGIIRQSIQKCIAGDIRYSNVGGYIFRQLDENNNIILNAINIADILYKYNKAHPEINGERKTVNEWCNIYHIKPATYRARIRAGYTPLQALKKEVR